MIVMLERLWNELGGIKNVDSSRVGIALFLVFAGYKYVNARWERAKLDAIPTLGHNGIFSSYLTVWRYIFDVRALVDEGAEKYRNAPFKIPTLAGWQVIVNGEQKYDEMRRAPHETLSSMAVFEDLFQMKWTISPRINENPLQDRVIRVPLTRNIGARFEDIRDECIYQFTKLIPPTDGLGILFCRPRSSANDCSSVIDWVEYSDTVDILQKIVSSVSNRYFVGLPLCRNDDWVDLTIKFALNVILNSVVINMFPEIAHPIVGRILTNRHSSLRKAVKLLSPIVEERMEMERQYGPEWPGKPASCSCLPNIELWAEFVQNDLISWLLDEAALNGEDWQKGSVEDLAIRILFINVVSIHTTSVRIRVPATEDQLLRCQQSAISQALYRLAANPHVADALRKEINGAVENEGGWSKTAFEKMCFLDSYLKESSRMGMIGAVGMLRKSLKDFTFSDGTFIPAGTNVALAGYSIHHAKDNYASPHTFQPSRYSDKGDNLKNHMATPSWGWLGFGAGKQACPGRFFAVNELKALLAHIILNYDVKFASDDAKFPEPICVAGTFLPNNKGKVLFRKRRI
ncbi:hypothetical protein V5O48_013711 [Marasmius crinis-equi]|uniref:Cytochrome P450 n=1 Tax=Marasmius crinis-equi TaxID=585013 RepID=A0ABR3EZC2_9AGAR